MRQGMLLLLAGCVSQVGDDPAADDAALSRPAFTSSAQAALVTPNASVSVTATVNNTGGTLSGGIVDVELYDPAGNKVAQSFTSNVRIASRTSAKFSYQWTAPTAPGTYTIKIGVFGAGWSPQYHWNNAAGSLVVAAATPAFTSSAGASGGVITANVSDTGGALSGGIVDLEVYNAGGTQVGQQFFSNVSFAAGQSQQFTWDFTPAAAGTYTIMIGVFGAGWSPDYHWNSDAGTFVVGSTCTPTTCAAQGKTCGTLSDGCGGTLTCGGACTTGGLPAGWLFTKGNKIYVSDGNGGGAVWMGRGVNVDDVYFCGYNNSLWMSDAGSQFTTLMQGAVSQWKATFLRVSLSMNSYVVSSWLANAAQYRTPMENAINAVTNAYVLVTLRSDSTMQETDSGNEATYIPTSATDDVYRGLVDSFAHSQHVLFGLSNEPGTISSANLVPIMSHAVGVIRAEEDRLGVPHHLVSVQGRMWTSDISFYSASPLPYDNVVYEVHGYPPSVASYTYSNIPVILGEYGDLSNSATFYADIESKQIPNLAWDYQPFSDCAPDLLNITDSAGNIQPTAWGNTVKSYLASH